MEKWQIPSVSDAYCLSTSQCRQQEAARGPGGEVARARKEPRTKAGNAGWQEINLFS